MGADKRKIVDPRELLEIIHYYETYGGESPEPVKQADLLRVARECLELRKALENVLAVDISRIQTDNRSIVAITAMKEAAEDGLGNVNKEYI